METTRGQEDIYTVERFTAAPGSVVWMGRSREQIGTHPFDDLVAAADDWLPLPNIPDDAMRHVLVRGVRLYRDRLRQVVAWVDHLMDVDVAVIKVNDVPGLLIRGCDRVAVLASCSHSSHAPNTVLL